MGEQNYTGKSVMVNNTNIFNLLQNKYDPYTGRDYKELSYIKESFTSTIATKIGIDKDKACFLALISNLGKIDGGEIALANINELLKEKDLPEVSELDIAYQNFLNIFADYDEKFTPQEMFELSNVILKKSNTIDGKVVELADDVLTASLYLISSEKMSEVEASQYRRRQMNSIKESYKNEGVLKVPEETARVLETIKQQEYNLDTEQLTGFVDSLTSDGVNIAKNDIINKLNTFEFDSKKKIKRL